MRNDSLGDRMKRYEKAGATRFIPRTPLIVRMDGKAFHTFTKHITADIDPTEATGFGEMLHEVMVRTALRCCEEMQGAVVAYTQSDEISIVLRDWDTHATQPWFGGQLQKIVSISAAAATAHFNSLYYEVFGNLAAPPAMFDARAFNIPVEEVNNYMVWRQQDAIRNSIQYLGRKYFSHKQMHQKNQIQIQDMLMLEHGINWNDIDVWKKRGTCIVPAWNMEIDTNIPIFSKEPSYIEYLVQHITEK